MNTETISFPDILRLIHPDHNPNIVDAGSKMRDAKMWRKDESILYRLGVQWGVIVPKKTGFGIRPTPNSTYTPPPSAVEAAKRSAQAIRTKAYQDLVKAQQREKAEQEAQAQARENNKKRNEDADVYRWRVKNRIFQEGDLIYIRTRRQTFIVTKQSPLRVYFMVDGKETYSLKKNVRHTI